MSVSSLGVGSGILTQDVLDQLREVDDAAQVTPITLDIANEEDKEDALDLVDAVMDNLIDSITELTSSTLYDERISDITGSSVSITADEGTDVQEFTLDVTVLATAQIEESGAFSAETDLIATATGTMNINVNGLDYTIDYDDTTTLDDLKDAINETAGDSINATVVQITTGEYRLFMSSVETGTNQDITVTDDSGFLSDDGGTTAAGTLLTTSMTAVQTAVDAEFTFNGQAITRESNVISDLVTGLEITLEETGSSDVSIEQDRDSLESRFESFVEHYNAAITQLDTLTLASTESDERGIFASESLIKNMKSSIVDMFSTAGGGVGYMTDYGFDVDEDGKMTIDLDTLNTAFDDDFDNVQIFFSGGDFDNGDTTTTTVDGVFTEWQTEIEAYTESKGTLSQFSDSITDRISTLEDNQLDATERLDDKYAILAKIYASYDALISRLNSASSMFAQMISTEDN